ncbi:MAG: VWA domain-containing protein [Bdellovibrionota bacterium]
MKLNFPGLFELGQVQLIGISIAVLLGLSFILKSRKRFRDIAQLVFKLVALFSLVIAIHQPYLNRNESELSSVLLVDISDSMQQETAEALFQKAKQISLKAKDSKLIVFGRRANLVTSTLTSSSSYANLKRDNSQVDRGGSNLEAAITELRKIQPGAALLISDANETEGDILKQDLSKIPAIYPLFPESEANRNSAIRLVSFNAPLISESGKTVTTTVVLENSSQSIESGEIKLFQADREIAKKFVTLNSETKDTFSFDSKEIVPGTNEIRAEFFPKNKNITQSSKLVYVTGERGETVLLLNGSREDARGIETVLNQQAYELTSIDSAQGVGTLADLEQNSVVILNNINRKNFTEDNLSKIENFVKQGGGLLMLGANNSFGPGRWKDTPVEKALPLEFLPPQTEQKRLNVAVILVLDKSRSMADGSKLEYAKEAAKEVIKNLKDEDYVGIIGFDDAPFVVVKLGQLSTIRSHAIDRVARLFAAGRTNLYPAADEARRSLMKVSAGRKHVIIMTDGKLPDAGAHYVSLVNNMRLAGITASTVMLGSEADEWLLKEMAERGGGAFYKTNDPRALPRIFLSDVKVSTGEKTLKENQEYSVRVGPQGVKSVAIKSFPPLKGYVETKKKEKAKLELLVYAAGTSEPLLASWDYGKGKSATFTSDANGRWSSYWISWRKYQTFWTELIDSLRPEKGDKKRVPFDLRYAVSKGSLQLDLAIFAEEGRKLLGTIQGPDGKQKTIPFSMTTIGRYQANLEQVSAGRQDIQLTFENTDLTPIAINLDGTLFGEQSDQGYKTSLLYLLADKTGGKVQPSADSYLQQASSVEVKEDKTWIFILGALLFYLLAVIFRESR